MLKSSWYDIKSENIFFWNWSEIRTEMRIDCQTGPCDPLRAFLVRKNENKKKEKKY